MTVPPGSENTETLAALIRERDYLRERGDNNARRAQAAEARAEAAEQERDHYRFHFDQQEARAKGAEKALREIEGRAGHIEAKMIIRAYFAAQEKP